MIKSMQEVAGTGNPEVGDYLAGLQATEPTFRSIRPEAAAARGMEQIGDREFSDAELKRQIEEICLSGEPEPGCTRHDLLQAYRSILAGRQDSGVSVDEGRVMHHPV